MTPEELESFKALGVKYVMDLRTNEESLVDPDPILPDVEAVRHSGLVSKGGEEIDFSPAGMSKVGEEGQMQYNALAAYYSTMPFGNEAFKILMGKLVEKKVPLLFHCATGKDRTGVATMIILAALGVSEEIILRDYLLSNYYHRETIQSTLSENAEKIEEHPILETLIQMRTGVHEEIGRIVLDAMLLNKENRPHLQTFANENRPSLKNTSINNSSERDPFLPYLKLEFGLGPKELEELRDYYLLP